MIAEFLSCDERMCGEGMAITTFEVDRQEVVHFAKDRITIAAGEGVHTPLADHTVTR